MIKQRELNKRYSDRINYYLNAGFWINATTMSGSQGEISHIDLTNGKDLVRIVMERDYAHNYNKEDYCSDYVTIYEKKFSYNNRYESAHGATIWNNEGILIYTENWYYTDRLNGVYYTKEEIDRIQKLRTKRFEQKRIAYGVKINKLDLNKIIRLVNSHKGYKSVRKSQIKSLYAYDKYYLIEIVNKDNLIIYK